MLHSDQIVTSVWASMASWFTPIVLFCFLNFMIATIYMASTFKNHHHQPAQLARVPSLLNRVKSINFPFYSPEHHYPFLPQTHHVEEPSISMSSSRLEHNSSSQIVRTPSLLERVKSINYFSFHSQEYDYPLVSQPHYEEPTNGISSFSSTREEQSSPSQLVRVPSLLERVRSFKFSGLHKPDQPQTPVPEPQLDWDSDHHVTRTKSSENYGVNPAKVSAKMKKSASEKGVYKKGMEEEIERRRPATVRERKVKKETASSGEDGGVDAKADDFINKFKQQLKLQRLDSLLRYKEMLGRGT